MHGGSQHGRGSESSVAADINYIPLQKASLPSEDRGSHLKECAQLEALKQPCHGVLPESPEDGAGRSPQPKTIHSDKYFRFTSSAFESKAAG